jgi:hypothetical protein
MMIPEAGTALIARSQPPIAALLVLGAITLFFAYVGVTAFDTSLPVIGPRRLGRPSQGIGILFFALAALSLAATVWQLRRRLNPNVDVIVDAEGIASQQSFRGRGRLAWSEISKLEIRYQNVLYVYGMPAAGKAKWLSINTAQIDVPAADLFAAIARHRPDLVGVQRP